MLSFDKNIIEKFFSPDQLNAAEIESLLASVDFIDWRSAHQCLLRIATVAQSPRVLTPILPNLLSLLSNAASPDRALINFEHFIKQSANPGEKLAVFRHAPRCLEILITLFAGSQFLSDILLQNPQHFEEIQSREQLGQLKTTARLYEEWQNFAEKDDCPTAKTRDALHRFQRLELLRIGAGDLLGVLDFRAITRQLSNLADAVVRICLDISAAQMENAAGGFAVLAFGKLGGRELNYSSDIDLLFICKSRNRANQKLGQSLIRALSEPTPAGFFYRVDMRLRPWGNAGHLTPALHEYMDYLKNHARLWEKQALLKARFIAGDEILGDQFILQARSYIFDPEQKKMLDTDALRREVHEMKQKIEQKLRRGGPEWGEVKSGAGSIRDIEFTTQYLQLLHGDRLPEIRSRGTLNALARLHTRGILPAKDFRILEDGYNFLRSVEHYLQIMHNRQTHQLPTDLRELRYLGRRLGFEGENVGKQFLERYQQHRDAIRAVFRQYLDSSYAEEVISANISAHKIARAPVILTQYPAYDALFDEMQRARHRALGKKLNAQNLVEVDAVALNETRWRVTIAGYDFLGALSLICGLLFVHRFNILDGHIFTYTQEKQPVARPLKRRRMSVSQFYKLRQKSGIPRRKIIDVFTVHRLGNDDSPDVWAQYTRDLRALFDRLKNKQPEKAQGELARLFADALPRFSGQSQSLLPVDIEIDNNAAADYTVLRIDAADTAGFLYEFTNALSLNRIYIARVEVRSLENRAHDTLFVTDESGGKIIDPEGQRQLRAAIVLVKQFMHLLPLSPNPASAMHHFRELVGQIFSQPGGYPELASLERPDVLDALVRLLGVSDFLWDDFLRMQHSNLFPVIRNLDVLKNAKSKEILRRELWKELGNTPEPGAQRKILNAFKDREMFRVDMRYIQNMISEFRQFSEELSDLAEVIMEAAGRLCYENLTAQFGEPMTTTGEKCAFSLCALGKFGGREIGFASDIELMVIYRAKGKTNGAKQIANAEFFTKLAQAIDKMIESRREGIFELDFRLRPYGKAGRLGVLFTDFESYFAPDGPAWHYERQSLVRLRPITGSVAFGRQIIDIRDRLLYRANSFDAAAMRAIRERQIRQLVAGGTLNAKFSPGGLVDLEYLVQGLQIIHGAKKPELRCPNTLDALTALKKNGVIAASDYQKLGDAYLFLRRLIEAQRMVRGNAKDLTVPPENSNEFIFLAKRLGYAAPSHLNDDLIRHTAFVQSTAKRLLEAATVL